MDTRKWILIIGIAALLAVLVYRFFPGIGGLQSSDDREFIKRKELATLRELLQERSDLQTRFLALNRDLERLETGLLAGNTPALAAVDIQNTLNRIATQIGIDIKSMRILKAGKEETSTYFSIPVEIQIQCSVSQLKELLYNIESSRKYLRINTARLAIRGVLQQDEYIFASLTVEGVMKNREV